MSNSLIIRTSERIARCIDQVNPHARADLATQYELGLLRAILAQCILYDNRNEWIFDRVIESVVEKYGSQGENRT
jgi:hypothetical protein